MTIPTELGRTVTYNEVTYNSLNKVTKFLDPVIFQGHVKN